ncbi:hypothetical protein QJS10_CPA05g00529 [Acorus calamus]|uniref:RNase H type-1 domain-containing protein n=1 Tax=Acorus calamus TaxID=4465 RepID=A0AAV9EXF0_ACOCL|nr:hypothetical protein QJS10_CPA05g00529 [Acorus calamus]
MSLNNIFAHQGGPPGGPPGWGPGPGPWGPPFWGPWGPGFFGCLGDGFCAWALALACECVKSLSKGGETNINNSWNLKSPLSSIPVDRVDGRTNVEPVYVISDESVDPNTRLSGAAFVVVREDPWQILGVGCISRMWSNPLRMKIEGILSGVSCSRGMGLSNVHVCSDAESLIKALQDQGLGPLQIQDQVSKIRQMDSLKDPLQFHKVSCLAVRALENIVRQAARTQSTRSTAGLLDDRLCEWAYTFSAVAAFLETAAAHCSVGLVGLEVHPGLVNK